MSYQSLYRKYRPQNFDEVVGQDSIIQTLNNAIKNDKISHAYLFSGPRGCGKTSIAKIFARQVNCTCTDGTCATCELFAKGEVSDVWEIDAASNNGVDEVRRIIDNVSYKPMDLKYKVYIIDEVHMLSKAAFNALLKTLEEPPKHVIFILATTEIYKIPLTVLSRCQRFDFKRISIEEIVKRVQTVLDAEKIVYEMDALEKVAKLADGGMRDALSLIEKVRTYSDEVTIDAVNASLQLVGEHQIHELISLVLKGEIKPIIDYWQELASLGIDENKFILDIQYYIRDLLIAGSEFDRTNLIKLLKLFNELEGKLQFTNNFSLVIEVYLIEMATLCEMQAINNQIPNVSAQVKQSNEINNNSTSNNQRLNNGPIDKASQQEKLRIQKEALLNANPATSQNQVSEISKPVVENKEQTNEVNSELSQTEELSQLIPVADDRDTEMMDFLLGADLDSNSADVSHELNRSVDARSNATNIKTQNITNDSSNELRQSEIANENNIIILDVLKVATIQDKREIQSAFTKMQADLEFEGKYGIAKFFEYAEIQAASPIGYVLTIDSKLINSYSKRIEEIEDIFNNYLQKKVKIFLLERNDWQVKRPDYVKAIKEMKDKNIFELAQQEFGSEIVKKI